MRSDPMPPIAFLDRLESDLRAIADREAPARPPAPRRRLATLLAALAAVAAVFVLASDPFGGGGGSRLSAAAQAAAVPPDVIDHRIETTRQIEDGTTVTVREESWFDAANAETWRKITDDPADGGRVEIAEQPGLQLSYDAAGGVVYERTNPGNWKGSDTSEAVEDLQSIRRALTFGGATDVGPASIAGQPVERFDFGSRDTNGQACSYYATRDDLRPVALDCTNLLGHPWLTSHVSYEWLGATAANLDLLSLTAQHPEARVDRAPLGECIDGQDYFGHTDPRNAPCYVVAPNG
jgi:hypothetical protein